MCGGSSGKGWAARTTAAPTRAGRAGAGRGERQDAGRRRRHSQFSPRESVAALSSVQLSMAQQPPRCGARNPARGLARFLGRWTAAIFVVLIVTPAESLLPINDKPIKFNQTAQSRALADECLRQALANLYRSNPRLGALQIGAHLAWLNANDPFVASLKSLALRGMRTILVEPQPHVFTQLRDAMAQIEHASIRVENAAACARDGNVTFYTIDERFDTRSGYDQSSGRQLPMWVTQIASMDLKHILKHQPGMPPGVNLREHVKEVRVPCRTVGSLLSRGGVEPSALGLLSVDAEGFDADILLGVNFATVRPPIVVWEYKHIRRMRQCKLHSMLLRAGYICDCTGVENAICMTRTLADRFMCFLPGAGCGAVFGCRVFDLDPKMG